MAVPNYIDHVLERLGSERIRWTRERSAIDRTSEFTVRCRAAATLSISDSLFEDGVSPPEETFLKSAHEMFIAAHRPLGEWAARCLPLIQCAVCSSFVDIDPANDTSKMHPDRLQVYCERQALEWMRRAETAGLKLGAGRAPMRG